MIFRIRAKSIDRAETLIKQFIEAMEKQLKEEAEKRKMAIPMTYFYVRADDHIDFHIVSPLDAMPGKFFLGFLVKKSKKALEDYFKSNGVDVKIDIIWKEKK